MYTKKIKRHMIYFLVTFLWCVSAKPTTTDHEEMEILNQNQLYELSLDVCSDLYAEEFIKNQNECMKKFHGPTTSSPTLTTPVLWSSQEKGAITVEVQPGKHFQLIVLLPEPNVGDEAPNYALLEPSRESEDIFVSDIKDYTLWHAEVVDGTPILWERGDLIPRYVQSEKLEAETPEAEKFESEKVELESEKHENYAMQVNLYNVGVYGKPQLVGLAYWNTNGDEDDSFNATNFCQNDSQRIYETSLRSVKTPPMILRELPINVTCTLQVNGSQGSSKLEYSTTSCTDQNACQLGDTLAKQLLIPKDIYISADEAEGDIRRVHVNWTEPILQPERYRVIVLGENNVTKEVPGDVRETVLEGCRLNLTRSQDGIYHVLIDSIIGGIGVRKAKRARLPDNVAAGGVWWAGGAAALGALLAALAARRRCAARASAPGLGYPDEKPPKEFDPQPAGPEPESAEDCWEIRSDRLLLHEVIGEGAFGVVRRGTMTPEGKDVAVKMLKDFPSLEEIRSFRSEMELMKSVGAHRHVVSLLACCSGRRPLIVAEFCGQGDLLTYLRCCWDVIVSKRNAKYYNNNIDTSDYRNDLFKCNTQSENSKLVVNKLYDLQSIYEKELTPLDLLSFCRQIAMGMEFLASNRVVHRDLAARNVLVTADKTLKIADFGLSRDVYEENQYKQKGNGKMPVKWMALESLTRRIYTTQSDVWSFGVVVWEVVTVGGSPYAGACAARLPRLLRAGYRMPRPAHCSPQLYDIMSSCWRASPRERPTFAELHRQFDDLLHGACADDYLSLQVDADDPPPAPKTTAYLKMLIRSKLSWSRSESYERPLKALQSNHYTSPPAARPQPA